jgi:hypothetical protein
MKKHSVKNNINNMAPKKARPELGQRVFVALSGGVDSSVAPSEEPSALYGTALNLVL